MLSRRTMRRPSTGSFHIPVYTVLPCHSTFLGRPTLTDRSCDTQASTCSMGAPPPGLVASANPHNLPDPTTRRVSTPWRRTRWALCALVGGSHGQQRRVLCHLLSAGRGELLYDAHELG